MPSCQELEQKRADLAAKISALCDASKAEDRAFTDAERTELDTLEAQYEAASKDHAAAVKDDERRKAAADRAKQFASSGRKTAHDPVSIGKVKENFTDDPKCGFETHRDFLLAVMDTAKTGAVKDNRLKYLATAGSDEQGGYSDPYGGFLLPRGFSPNLLSLQAEMDPTANLTTKIPMEAAILDIPARVDKNHTSSVSGGLRVYRRAEADTSASSRMEFEQVTLKAVSLFGIAYATEELLERSPISFVTLLDAGFRDEFGSKLIDEKISGTGAGMYEGVLNSPCTISVAKETGQAAATIVYENIVKMYARCWAKGRAVWLANHNTLPQLAQLNQSVGTGGTGMIWQPSAREGSPNVLMGLPIYFTDAVPTLGTVGDLILGVWSEYLEGTYNGSNVKRAESMHVRFVNHERTFKFWVENDGRCWWRSALTPKNGSTLSPFVTLATRA